MERLERNNVEITENFIDIDGIFKKKNPKFHKFIPRFFINFLKRLIHEDEINQAIYRNRNKWGLDFVEAILNEFQANIRYKNINNLPETDRCLIASNHPLGGLDGMALMHVAGERRKDIIFPVNDLLMNLPNLKELFIPINKHGSNVENIRIFNETFESDKTILYFPAGLVSRKQKKGVVKDIPWRKTFLSKAKRTGRHIIPVFINGRNSGFFYNFARWRKQLGIKANIEMVLLVDEMYKQKNKDINIIFGKKIPIDYFDKRNKDSDWALLLQQYVYYLGKTKGECEPFEIWYDKVN